MFFKKKKYKDYAISLDVGTEYVKALIFEVDKETKKGEVIGSGKVHQSLTDMQAGAVTDIHGVVKNSEKAIEMAAEEARIIPEKAVIGIAGELVKGTTTVVEYERADAKKKIDEKELQMIVERVQRRAFEKVKEQVASETGKKEVDVKLINAAVVDVKIDDYKVVNPIGFQGKNISMGVFNAYAPLVHLGALQTIAEELELELITIAAEPYAVARGYEGSETSDFNAIFIDIGGGTTDVAVVEEGGVLGTKMFAIGGRAFTKRIANEFDINFKEAEAMKLDYSAGKLAPEEMQQIKDLMDGDVKVWLSGVELALSEFDVELLPSRIMLCGGGSDLPNIASILKSDGWQGNLPFAKKPKIQFITTDDIANITDATKTLTESQDVTPMCLASVALDVIEEPNNIQKIAKRAIRVIQQ